MPLTDSERQASRRKRLADSGLIPTTVFAHREDIPAIRAYAAKLAKRREKQCASRSSSS